jgi:hypothetical protein
MKMEINLKELRNKELKSFFMDLGLSALLFLSAIYHLEFVFVIIAILYLIEIFILGTSSVFLQSEEYKNAILKSESAIKSFIVLMRSNNILRFIAYGVQIILLAWFSYNFLALVVWFKLGTVLWFQSKLRQNFKLKS